MQVDIRSTSDFFYEAKKGRLVEPTSVRLSLWDLLSENNCFFSNFSIKSPYSKLSCKCKVRYKRLHDRPAVMGAENDRLYVLCTLTVHWSPLDGTASPHYGVLDAPSFGRIEPYFSVLRRMTSHLHVYRDIACPSESQECLCTLCAASQTAPSAVWQLPIWPCLLCCG
jgi:hypothetical protein